MVDFRTELPPEDEQAERRAPDPPKKCNKRLIIERDDPEANLASALCERPVSILFAVVDAGVGQSQVRRVGALSEFTVGMGGPLKPHVVFVGWVGRCAECYRDDQEVQYGR